MSIKKGETNCPICGNKLKYYDQVSRIMRTDFGEKKRIKIRRFRCTGCRKMHRELPEYLMPYVQFKADIVKGVIEGSVSFYDLRYEDYPCEETMKRWKRRFGKEQ